MNAAIISATTRPVFQNKNKCFPLLERLLDEVSFAAPDLDERQVTVDAAHVRQRLSDIVRDEDLSRYILYISNHSSPLPSPCEGRL